ncbi:MAG TPA: hypothetical protein VN939_08565 [Chthoniobacterales bacterium]|nr:hypothetical protein [Chthoniobacterales bacterium]
MCLLIGALLLIEGCAGYNESEIRREAVLQYERTGQSSMLPDWRPQYDGAN